MRQLSAQTRDAIVQGTLRLLSGREFGQVTTRAIARSASVSETTVFRYFKTKGEILESILFERGQLFFADMDEVLGLVDGPREKLLALCRRHAQFAARNRELKEVLREGIEAGVFRAAGDLDVLAMMFHSAVPTVMLEEIISRKRPLSEERFVGRAESYHQLHLRSILTDGGQAR
ncbi:MAG: TetR/AcrR family transcriptional regulator [Candidatus Riflebacteria bacterium]|nr:TetR/AcrR family transcriptional regulator [Candidatus Riflebacteria bacterium]